MVGGGENLVLARRATRLDLYFIRAAPPSLTQLRQAKFSINPVNGVSLDNFAAALGRTGVIIPYLLRNFTYLTYYYYYYLISRRQICPVPVLLGQEGHHHLICSVAAVWERLTSAALVGT